VFSPLDPPEGTSVFSPLDPPEGTSVFFPLDPPEGTSVSSCFQWGDAFPSRS
jgi:hypothetical protein